MTTSFDKIWFENLSECFTDNLDIPVQDKLQENRQRTASTIGDYLQMNIQEALDIFNLRAQKKINFIPHQQFSGFSLIRGTRRCKVTYEDAYIKIENSLTQGYELRVLAKEVLRLEIDPFGGVEWKMQNLLNISNEQLVKKIFLSILDSDLKERLK